MRVVQLAIDVQLRYLRSTMRSSSVHVERKAHNPEVVGAKPTSAMEEFLAPSQPGALNLGTKFHAYCGIDQSPLPA